jgi:hypothetical protein
VSAAGPSLPAVDRDSRPWWEALARHELVLQRCDDCDTWRWPARTLCNRCGSLEWRWDPASGRGTIASWIVTRHPFSAAWPTPYVVVIVRLDEQDDVLIPGSYAGANTDDLEIGAGVVAEFDDLDVPLGHEPVTLLRWRHA